MDNDAIVELSLRRLAGRPHPTVLTEQRGGTDLEPAQLPADRVPPMRKPPWRDSHALSQTWVRAMLDRPVPGRASARIPIPQ
jgi:hypothetical protein